MSDYILLSLALLNLGLSLLILRRKLPEIESYQPTLSTRSTKAYAKPDKNAKLVPKSHDDWELYERELQSRN